MTVSGKARLLVAPIVAAVGLSACHADSGSGADHSAPPKDLFAHSNQIRPVPYDQVPDGGNLRWPIDSFPANFNVLEVDGNQQQPMAAALPTVWHFRADGTPYLDTDVVDRAAVTNRDPQVIKYHINPRAAWSDGTPITYREFAGIFHAMDGKNPAYKPVSTTGYRQITSVERGASDKDVMVTFAQVYPEWQSLFSPLIPAALTATPEAFTTSWKDRPTVSGGPFKIDKINTAAKTITVKRNDKWWGRKPKLNTITFITLSSNAQVKAFESDQVDWFEIGTDPAAYKQAQDVSGAGVRKANGRKFQHIDLGQQGALADRTVRQAVMLSLDRVDDAKAMLSPLDWPATTLDSHIWMNNQAQYKATCGDYCTTDVARAGSLLESVGYQKDSKGIYAKDGKELSLTFLVPAGSTTWSAEAGIQQNALKKAGIKVVLRASPSDTFLRRLGEGNFDLTVFFWSCSPFPVSDARELYATKGTSNFTKIGTPELDALLDEANATLDAKKRVELTYQADQKVWEEGHSAALFQLPDLVAVKQTLVNFGAFGFADIDYTMIGFKA